MSRVIYRAVMVACLLACALSARVTLAEAPPKEPQNRHLAEQLPLAKQGNYWAQYRVWAAYHKGANGVQKDPAEAQKWLAELVKGAYLATFRPAKGFAPRTPGEFLKNFSGRSELRSEPASLGGASFFRTRAQDGVLIGSFLTAYPDKMRQAIAANPSLELLSIQEVTPEMFVRHDASPQESLDTPGAQAVSADRRPAPEPLKTGQKRDTLLYVNTDPPGAKVLLNGKEVGASNGLFRVEPGTGSILVELEGRKPVEKQLTIRANGVTRLVLKLEPQTEVKAKVGAKGDLLDGPPPQDKVQSVSHKVGVKFFKDGDSITIMDVKATSPNLKNGDKVIVRGYYTLASQSKASLLLSATDTKGSGKSPVRPGQTIGVTAGKGDFELSHTLEYDGYLHVTFYADPGGKPFGGLYFGTAKQMQEIKHWNVRSWYTAK